MSRERNLSAVAEFARPHTKPSRDREGADST